MLCVAHINRQVKAGNLQQVLPRDFVMLLQVEEVCGEGAWLCLLRGLVLKGGGVASQEA